MKAKQLIGILLDKAIEEGEDFEVKVYDENCGEYRDFEIDTNMIFDTCAIVLK